jgi:hypothetical protein
VSHVLSADAAWCAKRAAMKAEALRRKEEEQISVVSSSGEAAAQQQDTGSRE